MEYALCVEGLPAIDFLDVVLPLWSSCQGDFASRAGAAPRTKRGCHQLSMTRAIVQETTPAQSQQRTGIRATTCGDIEAMVNAALRGRATPTRHVPHSHRVNLAWLYAVIQNDGNISIKHVCARQQCVDFFAEGVHERRCMVVAMYDCCAPHYEHTHTRTAHRGVRSGKVVDCAIEDRHVHSHRALATR